MLTASYFSGGTGFACVWDDTISEHEITTNQETIKMGWKKVSSVYIIDLQCSMLINTVSTGVLLVFDERYAWKQNM